MYGHGAAWVLAWIVGLALVTVAAAEAQHSVSSTVERCIQESLGVIVTGCSSDSVTKQLLPRDSLTKLLRNCFSTDTASNQSALPARILVMDGAFTPLVAKAASVYQDVTGTLVVLAQVPFSRLSVARIASTQNARNLSATHEVWMVTPTAIGDGLALGAFKDITDLVQLDGRLQWEGILPSMRISALTYKSRVVGLPLSAYSSLLYYRKDVFARHNISVPRTWRELLETSARFNGTEGMWGFCGGWSPCTQLGTALMRVMLASYTQTLGPTHGWLIDPETMNLLLDSPAMAEVLDVMKGLFNISPPDAPVSQGCIPGSILFRRQQCLMAIDAPTSFKYISHTSRADIMAGLQGNLGVALVPGSDYVLDRTASKMVECDEQRCPYAERALKTSNGSSTYWVNYAPGFDANLVPTNAQSPPELGYFSFSVVSYITSPDVLDTMVFHPDAEIYPSRTSQYQPERWAAAGFNLSDATQYCRAQYASLTHPNLNVHLRIPGASRIVSLLGEISSNVTLTNQSIAQIMATAQAKGRAIINSGFPGNATALREEYWASLNRPLPPRAKLSPLPPPPVFVAVVESDSSSSSATPIILGLCLALPVAAVALLGILAWRKYAGSRRAKGAWRPAAGPLTTLVITDIENSTNLWEQLDATVLDVAMRLHNACMRTLAAKHMGYESAWEGDSFILAFQAPTGALQFALEVQTDMLHLDWPFDLLQCDMANEEWMQKPLARLAPATSSGLPQTLSSLSRRSEEIGSQNGGRAALQGIFKKTSIRNAASASLNFTATSLAGASSEDGEEAGSGPLTRPAHILWGGQIRRKWLTCPATATNAVLVWRGFRVRIGLHAGLDNVRDCTYNNRMQRYHFAGAARNLCNAVASAAHGGQIIMDGHTLNLLLTADKALPSEARVFHMGHHQLQGVDGDPTQLVVALPQTLKCRIAAQQTDLRSLQCVLPGVLQTPLPTVHSAPVVVLVQLSGILTLLQWNRDVTIASLRLAYRCFLSQTATWHGVILEDYLVPAGDQQQLTAANVGCLSVAFLTAQEALQFATGLRQDLVALDWDPELLSHELCEKVGTLPSSHSVPNAAGLEDDPALLRVVDKVVAWSASDATSSSVAQTLSPTVTSHEEAREFQLSAHHTHYPAALSPTHSSRLSFHPQSPLSPSVGRQSPLPSDATQDGQKTTAISMEEVWSQIRKGQSQTSMASSAAALPTQVSNKTLGTQLSSKFSKKLTKKLAAPSSGGGIAASDVVLDATILRGLRPRMLVVSCGRGGVKVLARSSGRVVFVDRTMKAMASPIRTVGPGQIKVLKNVKGLDLSRSASDAAQMLM